MIGLFRREFYEKKKLLIQVILGVCVFALLPNIVLMAEETSGGLGAIMSLLFHPFAYLLLGFFQNAMLEDERKVTAYYFGSTPWGRDGVVAAKYGLIFLMSAILTVFIAIGGLLSKLRGQESAQAISLAVLLMLLQLFLRSIEMPFIFTLGSRYGSYVKVGVVTLLCFVVIGYGLFGPVPKELSFDIVIDRITRFLAGKSRKTLILVSTPIVGVLYYLSYRLSCRGYWKGVEEYEA